MIEPQASRFWVDALRLKLVDEASLRQAWDSIEPEKRTPDAIDRRLARQTIQMGQLTMWQAQQIYSVRNAMVRIEHYVLLDMVGKGGMGRVYKARDTKLNRIVAVKTLTTERMTNERALSRFQREIFASAQLEHENLVRIYDGGRTQDGFMYLVMEFIEGKSAGQLLIDQGRLDPVQAVKLCREVALGLEHAREKGLIHRDVHPWNILINPQGRAKLTDLGLVISEDHIQNGVPVTRDGVTVGNFDYLSPEQAKDSHAVDTRSDIYSLGCTIYHMIVGKPPFTEESLSAKLIAHQERTIAPLHQMLPGLPIELSDVVSAMMAKERDDRYANPAEVAAALEPFLDESLYDSAVRLPILGITAKPGSFSSTGSGSKPNLKTSPNSNPTSEPMTVAQVPPTLAPTPIPSPSPPLVQAPLPEPIPVGDDLLAKLAVPQPTKKAKANTEPTAGLFSIQTDEDNNPPASVPVAPPPAPKKVAQTAPLPPPKPIPSPPAPPVSLPEPDFVLPPISAKSSKSSKPEPSFFSINVDEDQKPASPVTPQPTKPKAKAEPEAPPPAPVPPPAVKPKAKVEKLPPSEEEPSPIIVIPTDDKPKSSGVTPIGDLLQLNLSGPSTSKPVVAPPTPPAKSAPKPDLAHDEQEQDEDEGSSDSHKVSPWKEKLRDPGLWLWVGSGTLLLVVCIAVGYLLIMGPAGSRKKSGATVAQNTTDSGKKNSTGAKKAESSQNETKTKPEPDTKTKTEDSQKTESTDMVKADATPKADPSGSDQPDIKFVPEAPKTQSSLKMVRKGSTFNPSDLKDAFERIANNRSELLLPENYEFQVSSTIDGFLSDANVTVRPASGKTARATLNLKITNKPLVVCGTKCSIRFENIDFVIEPADSKTPLIEYLDDKPVDFNNCTFKGRAQDSLVAKKP